VSLAKASHPSVGLQRNPLPACQSLMTQRCVTAAGRVGARVGMMPRIRNARHGHRCCGHDAGDEKEQVPFRSSGRGELSQVVLLARVSYNGIHPCWKCVAGVGYEVLARSAGGSGIT
jgi:hypothetical protein